jgi:hypothetical protein
MKDPNVVRIGDTDFQMYRCMSGWKFRPLGDERDDFSEEFQSVKDARLAMEAMAGLMRIVRARQRTTSSQEKPISSP